MRTIGNVLWLVLAGWWLAIGYVIAGILNCITIIGIPFGVQSFKLAGYTLWPFGRVVVERPGASPTLGCLGNVIWLVLGGLALALGHVLAGVLLCITIIGIPLGVASFKMAVLALTPFGKVVVPRRRCRDRGVRREVLTVVPGRRIPQLVEVHLEPFHQNWYTRRSRPGRRPAAGHQARVDVASGSEMTKLSMRSQPDQPEPLNQ